MRILYLVGGGVFVSIVAAISFSLWLEEWIWAVAVSLAVGAFIALWVSRRIAGPFYRIEQDLESLLSGAAAGRTIQLRPGDPLQHLAGLVNQLIERTKR